MSYYRRSTQLLPQPFTGMLAVVDDEARRHEISVEIAKKEGWPEPESAVRTARGLRAVERILVGTERFWDSAPPAAMSIKEMIARFEAAKAAPPTFVDPAPPPTQQAAPKPVRAAATLEGDDDDE